MDAMLFLSLTSWCMVAAMAWATRHDRRWMLETHAPAERAGMRWSGGSGATARPGSCPPWATASIVCVLVPLVHVAIGDSMVLSLVAVPAAIVAGRHWVRQGRDGRVARFRAEEEDILWIIQQRGSVQDQIMRACEREAMERRLRRCQATLMLTRRGGRDLSRLFRCLEERVAAMEHDPMDAAAIVGGFATHLRHVFMESDRDDIPLGEACMHVERWAQVLRSLGAEGLEVTGAPLPDSPWYDRRIPAMLMLGATERLGMAALQSGAGPSPHWHWTITEHAARLESMDGAALLLPVEEIRDWDAAFMLRHGGIAHAGGTWSFELPLLPA